MENENATIYVVIFFIIIFVFIIAVIYVAFSNNSNDKPKSIKKDEYYVLDKIHKKQKDKTINIDDLLVVVSDDNLAKNDLFLALQYYINNLEIPKENELEINKYMLFVFLISSHKNANAKLIAYMSITLKRLYPNLAVRIELEEQKGVEYRKKRQQIS